MGYQSRASVLNLDTIYFMIIGSVLMMMGVQVASMVLNRWESPRNK
jgi:hypothetical protein